MNYINKRMRKCISRMYICLSIMMVGLFAFRGVAHLTTWMGNQNFALWATLLAFAVPVTAGLAVIFVKSRKAFWPALIWDVLVLNVVIVMVTAGRHSDIVQEVFKWSSCWVWGTAVWSMFIIITALLYAVARCKSMDTKSQNFVTMAKYLAAALFIIFIYIACLACVGIILQHCGVFARWAETEVWGLQIDEMALYGGLMLTGVSVVLVLLIVGKTKKEKLVGALGAFVSYVLIALWCFAYHNKAAWVSSTLVFYQEHHILMDVLFWITLVLMMMVLGALMFVSMVLPRILEKAAGTIEEEAPTGGEG